MNKIFKVIWNPATGNYTVTSETAKSRGKKSGRSKLLISALVAGGMLSSFGALANAGNDNGQGVDYGSGSAGDGWVAIGKGAKANTFMNTSGSSTAVGYDAIAEGQYSSAIGSKTHAIGGASMAFGVSAISEGDRSIALGASSYSLGQYSMALGRYSKALGKLSIAMGDSSKAEGANAIALGNATKATEIMSIALGDTANASKAYSMALGASSVASEENAIALGRSSVASGTDSLAFGRQSLASAANAIAIGAETEAAENATAIGNNAKAKGTNSMAMGFGSLADKVNTIALGNGSQALADNAIAIGQGNKADGVDAIALGNGSQSRGLNTIALGTASNATGDKSLALGSNSSANGINSVALGADSIADLDNTVSVGNSSLKRKIVNVKNGAIKSDSSDAINGSQLYDLSSNIATYFGGNASVNTDGVFTGPTYKIGETNYYNVGDALAAINSSFSTSLGDALLWDATAGKFSAKHGTNGDASVITDVADGEISDSSSDAVNGSQLHGVSSYVVDALGGGAEVNADGTITAPTYTIANADYDNVGDALNAIDTTLDDALLWDADAGENGAFSAAHGKDKTASVITNVANGAISAASSDAINGSQLYTTNKYIADALGGDAEVNADGTITAPTYTIANAEYNNVGDALDALDDNALLWDETANGGAGAYNASHDGKASIITNVANGSISEDSTDAVNGSQLNATNMMIEQNTQIINQLAGNTDATYIQENGAGINYVRTNDDGLAFNDASAQGVGATAIGYNSVAKGDSSVAIGQGSYSDVDTGIALGSSSVSSRVIAKGSRDTSITENGVVIGYDTTDGELLGALSIGDDGKYRQIINVADGSEAHDAVTVRQLQNAIGAVATTPSKYFHANSTEEDSLAVGTDSLAMGAKTIVNGDKGIGIGYGAYVDANALNGIAIGSNAQVIHVNSIAIGNGSTTTRGAQTNYTAYNMDAPQNSVGEFSVGSADGQRQITNVAAGSADTDAVNVGQLKVTDAQVSQNTQSITNLDNRVTNLDSRVTNIENGIGDIVTTGSTKYFKTNTDGVDASAQGKDSVAIGSGSIAAADNSVALGTGSVAEEENTISVGSSTNQRRITNVAAGVNATDAVNVSQLKSSEAGGVRYDTKADGSIDYSNITLGGGNGGTTRISNVSAGVNNNDAVNYAQLKQSVQETKQYTDQRMVEMDNKLSKTESKLSGGIASAMAMTGLPQAYTPGASMASIGGGTYNGESAVALGVSMVSANGRWVYKLQGSTNSQGEYSAALGAGIQW
ncbi:TPA: YadA-like family protein [Escherichia coli]|uniref:YadA-like family protein n=1 Tax=Escherichia coli TaxID=562 RepID=UPI0002A1A089|nr:YadA-like family protein [Escherichia coli]EFA8661931.1 adhesin [Escherichia coli O8:H9]EAC1380370.1 adhesin [Escherichia coli]EFB3404858.1 adhesin [Escherichia coli]EFO3585213.1 adhesin [Escherichia coli]EFO4713991.1 adhesin [Escherichia coli]